MTIRPFLHFAPPQTFSSVTDVTVYARRLYDALLQTRRGKLECVVELTLAANADSTTLVDHRLSAQSVLVFSPLTANAAAETVYVTAANRDSGYHVITHANNAQTDRSFLVAIIG